MRKDRRPKRNGDGWVTGIAALVTLIASIAVFATGLPDRWLAAIFCTVGGFSGLISYFRKQWAFREFWMILAGALTVHLALFYWLFAQVLMRISDVPLIICVPFIFLECGVIFFAIRFVETRFFAQGVDQKPPLKY